MHTSDCLHIYSANVIVLGICCLSIQFLLLSLPEALITRIFSFLSIKDRLNARVNKKLNAIELESKYYVRSLAIGDLAEAVRRAQKSVHNVVLPNMYRNDQLVTLSPDCLYSSDFIRRITQNVTLGQLIVGFKTHVDKDVYRLLHEFDVDFIVLVFESNDLASSVITGSNLLLLVNSCKVLNVTHLGVVAPEDLLALYKKMESGTSKLKGVMMAITISVWKPFLALLGITFVDAKI
ncbi:hypothetical protein PMAYCL1PPCAC_27978, partial [Pristionchus mayeri]